MQMYIIYKKTHHKNSFLIKMKYTLLFLILGINITHALNTYSQSMQLSLHIKNKNMKDVFREIERNSEFLFIYEDNLDLNKKVTVKVNNENIRDILNKLFESTDIQYIISDRQIALSKKNVTEQTPSQQGIRVTGSVSDEFNAPLPGVAVAIRGTTQGTTTDENGEYSLSVPSDTCVLQFRYIGYETQEVAVGTKRVIAVVLSEATTGLDEVVVVAFGKQAKESVVSSITTVNTKDLKVPSSNLTTALAGRMAGLVSYQTTGAPGEEDAQFFVRSVTSFGSGLTSPLILIDNIEMTAKDLSRLNPDDIASFSILKDASATALYGARGANGVVLVTTKEGEKGAVKVQVRYESSLSTPTTKVDVVNPVTFMEYSNIASMTRHGEYSYPQSKIQMTKDPNRNPFVYPAVDWKDMLTRDHSFNHRANLNLTGGGNAAQYYLAGSFSQDNGILEVDKRNPFNTNINLKKYSVRSNVNLNLTRYLEAKVRVSANFEDYTGPIGESGSGGANTYGKTLLANPILFPPYYEPDRANQYFDRLLFGNYSDNEYGVGSPQYLNPYAEIMKGYEDVRNNTVLAQIELHLNLNMVTEGLKARFIGSVTRYSGFNIQRSYKPFYYQYIKGSYDPSAEFPYDLAVLNPEGGTDFIEYSAGDKFVRSTSYAECAVLYNRKFNNAHDVGALLVGSFKESMDGSPINLDTSLPSRNVSLAGRFTYGFDQTYFAEFNFGLNGSERFDPSHRWGFFPSVGAGWQISNERFWQGIKRTIPTFKLRATYGLVGNDVIVSDSDRFFFTSNVNLNGPSAGYFGNDPTQTYTRPTISIGRYANPLITWEVSYKTNLALELGLLNDDLSFIAEFYHENRTNIVQLRPDVPSTMGLTAGIRTNYGESEGKGIDLTLNYNKALRNSMWYIIRGNFTYGTAKITKYDELDYSEIAPWKSKIGQKVGQTVGYVAERLFIDDNEVSNSPVQLVGQGIYQAGDIKYRDINDDGVIDEYDIVPMGYPQTPEIQYGFGGSFGYKSFDISAFFQGQARYSFFLSASSMAPFVEVTSGGMKGNRAMLSFIADNVWTETNRDLYAKWPRLSPDTGSTAYGNRNNFVNSNYWMRTPWFLRLKSVEVGYTIPVFKGVTPRVYASGTNLFTFSNFKLWDPEMGGNGLSYPIQRVFNLGIQVNF
jgi:TonB-linked SusC/RagA family outer membrane protein